jgi:hypothetical protein
VDLLLPNNEINPALHTTRVARFFSIQYTKYNKLPLNHEIALKYTKWP